MNARLSKTEALLTELADIAGLDRGDSVERWCEVFDCPPPKYLSPRYMTRVLIWEAQTRLIGGSTWKADNALKRIASGKPAPTTAKAGSHLIREWNGRTYQVEVTGEGYVMDGKTYRSLSAIARRITGARWSGPRFFGLT